jgi:hypothetical protein
MIINDGEEQKKPLDMTTDEAMKFLFPPEVVKELKQVANPPTKTPNPCGDNGSDKSDSAYENHS